MAQLTSPAQSLPVLYQAPTLLLQKNSSGCVSPGTSATISAQPATPAAPTVNLTQPTCTVATGTITVTAPTGTGMTYSINGTTYQSGLTFTGVATGTYTVIAKVLQDASRQEPVRRSMHNHLHQQPLLSA